MPIHRGGVMHELLEGLRFGYERELFAGLRRTLGDTRVQRSRVANEQILRRRRRDLLGDAVRVTADLLPEIHERYQACLQLLGGGLDGDLFVGHGSTYNASVFADGRQFDMMIHSALLDDLTLDELSFVLGHELGHVVFGHSAFSVHEFFNQEDVVDPRVATSLLSWSRSAEVSADRIGMVCCGTLQAAATALFKTSSGLRRVGPELVLSALRRQYDELVANIDSGEGTGGWLRTHPMTPIRFKALELVALDVVALCRNRAGFSERGFRQVDAQLMDLLMKLDARLGSSMPDSRFRPLPMVSQQETAMVAMAYVALIDGPLSAVERRALTETHMRLGGPFPLDEVLRSAMSRRSEFIGAAPDELRARAAQVLPPDVALILGLCVAMCIADGQVSRAEAVALQTAAKALEAEQGVLDCVRRDVEQRGFTPTDLLAR